MDLNNLKIFYQVASVGNITAAAPKLGINPSYISRIIGNLETEIGTKLFERHYRGVTLTDQGKILFEAAKKAFIDLDQAETIIKESKSSPVGILKVTTTFGIASFWLIKYVARFYEKYPEIRLHIDANDEDLNLIRRGADAAIRPFIPENDEFVQVYLLSYPLKLFASPKYLEQFGTPQKPEDLDNHRIVTFSKDIKRPFGDTDWHLNLGNKKSQSREPYLQVNSSMALSKVAQDGLGIVSLSKNHQAVKGAALVEVLPEISGPEVKIHYVYPKKMQNIKRITSLGEFLVDCIKEENNRREADSSLVTESHTIAI